MSDPVPARKRGRKPQPAIFAVTAAPSAEAAFEVPAALSSVIAAATPPASPVVSAARAPEPVEPEVAAELPIQAAPEIAPIAEPAIEPAADMPLPADETPIASVDAEPLLKGPTMATTYDAAASTATSTAGAATDKAKALFGDFNDRAKTAMEKSAKIGEDVTEFTKGNVEALVTSGRVAAKGAETIAQDVAESVKKHFESGTAALKSFASVKSPTELFQLQSDYAKTYFDGAVAEASKFSESMMKLMGDIAQPLSSRYALAAEKFKAPGL